MARSPHGSKTRYAEALRDVLKEGVPPKHLDLLRVHAGARSRSRSVGQLAEAVGYAHYGAANLQYGIFAHRIGEKLVLTAPPRGFWLHVVLDWAGRQPAEGDTQFVLREEMVHVMAACGVGLPTKS